MKQQISNMIEESTSAYDTRYTLIFYRLFAYIGLSPNAPWLDHLQLRKLTAAEICSKYPYNIGPYTRALKDVRKKYRP